MAEILRLTEQLGKVPSGPEMNALGRFSEKPYKKRWGSFAKGRDTAYVALGFPILEQEREPDACEGAGSVPRMGSSVRTTFSPKAASRRKKVQFGEPIDFRGLRFAPGNEQGVVYLFGMISRELGFLVESVRTEYPDCEGKWCVDKKRNVWEQVLIEFEYKSSNFQEHGHNPDGCDLIVCWEHDWENCPIEVIELRSTIPYLSKDSATK